MEAGLWTADPRVLVLAVAIDLVFGDPPNVAHPVAWLGRFVNMLVRVAPRQGARAQLAAGGVVVVLALAISAVTALAIATLTLSTLPTVGAVLLAALFLKSTFAIRGLGKASSEVARRLRDGDLAAARLALRSLCSRDPSTLNASQVAAAAIESVAENISDSVIAPLFFYALLGLPGAALYRAANTLDAMIGYHGRFEYLGKAAARLDDLLNLIPARLTAALLLLAGCWRRAHVANGIRVLVRDGAAPESPNAGRPMAAMAGLLDVALEKPGHYLLGKDGAAAEGQHLKMAWLISRDAALLGCACAVAGTVLCNGWIVNR
ncbi:MAG: cobalamin biosynthesis protein CobD [Deltaproteobacteria bacterium]|nr:cobalamin biosynthesis protein CobD [Deltaproteobacteria bacterium]